MEDLRDFFPAKNRGQAMGLFRIGSLGDTQLFLSVLM